MSNKKTIIEKACNKIVKDFDGVLNWTWGDGQSISVRIVTPD